jgi:hypothetical protein
MTDSTWLKTYNQKNIWAGSGSICCDGFIGAGTSSPTAKLHVLTNSYSGSDPSYGGIYCYNPNYNQPNSICVRTNQAGSPFYSMDVAGVTGWSMGIHNGDGNKFKIKNNWNFTGSDVMTLTSDNLGGMITVSGNPYARTKFSVTENVTTYTYEMGQANNGIFYMNAFVNGTINYDASTYIQHNLNVTKSITYGVSIYQSSDGRLKSDKRNIENALDTIDKLNPQIYNKWDTMNYLENSNAKFTFESGLIAQEIYNIPELKHLVNVPNDANIAENDWGTKTAGLNYTGLIPYLISAIKDLKNELALIKTHLNLN